jgi:putative oxidoreductase
MKIASTIARYLLGVIFLVFGLNGFLNFIPMPPPTGTAAQFMGALFVSHFLVVVFLLELIPAALLLANRYVALALVLLGPVIVNIVLFHTFMAPSGLPLAALVVILWLLVAASVRSAFNGILQAKA